MINSRNSAIAIVLAAMILLSLPQCGKRTSLGSKNKVLVFADSSVWVEIQDTVKEIMEREIFTPQPENIFYTLYKNPEELGKVTRFPNLLILGTLNSEGEMQNLIDKLLSPQSKARVKQDSAFLFKKKDPWALDQILVVCVAKDVPTLKKNLDKEKDAIFNTFDNYIAKYVFQTLYDQLEQKEIEKSLMERHGWSVRVQHDYYVAVDSVEMGYVWLRRFDPQRWLSVYYEPTDDPSLLSKEWMLETRQKLANSFYDGDYVYEDSLIHVQRKVVDFNGRYAIRLDGVWQNDEHVMGGPFRSYGFYNKSDGRLYLIDMAVYAPGERKYPYIRQVEGIASTFKTKK